jgi:hypothetical protein
MNVDWGMLRWVGSGVGAEKREFSMGSLDWFLGNFEEFLVGSRERRSLGEDLSLEIKTRGFAYFLERRQHLDP